MLKKTCKAGIFLAVLILPVGLHANGKQAWHKLTESQRGLKIVSAALSGLGTKGYNCKQWLQLKVIQDVTDKHVFLPVNASEPGDRWIDEPNGHVLSIGKDFSKARAGDIIQMIIRFKNGSLTSHTAVIAEVNAKRLVLIESNYSLKNTVTKRELTIESFQAKTVSNQYTIYRIK